MATTTTNEFRLASLIAISKAIDALAREALEVGCPISCEETPFHFDKQPSPSLLISVRMKRYKIADGDEIRVEAAIGTLNRKWDVVSWVAAELDLQNRCRLLFNLSEMLHMFQAQRIFEDAI